jgi:hypothetical protein
VANGHREDGYRDRDYGNSDCFEQQITRRDRYTGDQVVGYKTICR